MDRFVSSTPNVLLSGYPLPLRIHAGLLLGLGAGLTYAPALVINNPLFKTTERLLGVTPYVIDDAAAKRAKGGAESPASRATRASLSSTGMLAIGLGLSYVGTAALPGVTPQNNQLVYAAIPLRFLMVAGCLVKWIIDPSSRDAFKATIIGEDFVGALWMLYCMKDWRGWSAYV